MSDTEIKLKEEVLFLKAEIKHLYKMIETYERACNRWEALLGDIEKKLIKLRDTIK
jgi:hypothetical protein